MEEPKRKKKYKRDKPFIIENHELLSQGKVDQSFRVLGKKGTRLRMAETYDGQIVMINKKNWQDEYIQLFNSLSDPWNTKLYDIRPPDSSDTKCPPGKIRK